VEGKYRMKKAITILLLLSAFGVFSQKKMMAHPSVGFQFGPVITNYRSDQNFDYTNYFCYSYFGQLSNRFNLKKNALELSFGFGNSHFRSARKYLYATAYESSRFKYQTYLLPIHLTYFFNTKSKFDPFFGAGFIIKSNHSIEIIDKYDDGHIDTNYGVGSLTAPLRLNLGIAYTINSKLSIRAESSWEIKLISTQEYFYKPFNFFIGIFVKLPDFEWK
jgi:hypothetical protein